MSHSSAKAEYEAIVPTSCELMQIKHLFKELRLNMHWSSPGV